MDLGKTTLVGVLCALLMIPMDAWAMCTSNDECEEGRVCEGGICILTGSVGDLDNDLPANTGWAMAGGIIGLIGALGIGITGFASGAAAEGRDEETAIPLGVVAALLTVAMVPVAFAGARSARRAGDVRGVGALRVLGWILYGLTIAGTLGSLYVLLLDEDVPPELIYALTVGGVMSELFMAIDAFVGYGQAKSQSSLASGVMIGPAIGAVRAPDGQSLSGTLGVGLRF